MENEIMFTGMNVVNETDKLVNLHFDTITSLMTENEVRAYKLGVENTLSALYAILDDAGIVVHVDDLETEEELDINELNKIFGEKNYG